MRSIPMVVSLLFRKACIILLPVIAFSQCDNSDEVKDLVCAKDLRITKVLPDRNPVTAPIMIVGKGFTNFTKVIFKDVESEVNLINDTTITTRPPVELKGSEGLLELTVVDGACRFTTGFTLTNGFEDRYRASPPDILFPDPGKRVFVNVKDTIDTYHDSSKSLWRNIWGGGHTIVFGSTSYEYGLTAEFLGSETIFYGIGTPLWSRFNKQALSMEIKIIYDQNNSYYGQVPGDYLVGGFYEMTIQTRQGLASGTFLFLQSTVTGRQFIFESITY